MINCKINYNYVVCRVHTMYNFCFVSVFKNNLDCPVWTSDFCFVLVVVFTCLNIGE